MFSLFILVNLKKAKKYGTHKFALIMYGLHYMYSFS